MSQHPKKQLVISCGTCVYRFLSGGYEFLLVQSYRGSPSWGFPKGHVEPGEALETAALRETYEEAGVNVKLLEQLPKVRTKNKKEKKDVYFWLATQSCDVIVPTSKDPDAEIANVEWHHINVVPTLIYRYQLPVFYAAMELIENSREL